jgi:hypothetical protein
MMRCLLVTLALITPLHTAATARDYEFDGSISRAVLENYLARSITGCRGGTDTVSGRGEIEVDM